MLLKKHKKQNEKNPSGQKQKKGREKFFFSKNGKIKVEESSGKSEEEADDLCIYCNNQ